MRIYILAFLMVMSSIFLYGQKNEISVNYGGAFTGWLDLQGKHMALSYKRNLNKHFALYASIAQASMNGQRLGLWQSDKFILGGDAIKPSLIDLSNQDNNNELVDKYVYPGSKTRYDPPHAINNSTCLDLGLNIKILQMGKMVLYGEGNIGFVNVEWTGVLKQQVLKIDSPAFISGIFLEEVVLNTTSHEHFLDLGYGFGLGINYKLKDALGFGINLHTNSYLNDAQNIIRWSGSIQVSF